MSQKVPIILFPGVKILPKLTMQQTKEYLDGYCTVDDLGNTLYAKKIGNDKTTYAIEFDFGEISKVRKIKDENGNNLDDVLIFENNCFDDLDYDDDDLDYDES